MSLHDSLKDGPGRRCAAERAAFLPGEALHACASSGALWQLFGPSVLRWVLRPDVPCVALAGELRSSQTKFNGPPRALASPGHWYHQLYKASTLLTTTAMMTVRSMKTSIRVSGGSSRPPRWFLVPRRLLGRQPGRSATPDRTPETLGGGGSGHVGDFPLITGFRDGGWGSPQLT